MAGGVRPEPQRKSNTATGAGVNDLSRSGSLTSRKEPGLWRGVCAGLVQGDC